jgi:hypothetical protein
MQTIPVPNITSGDEVVKALNLLLHDLRTPVSVAQGYLRLLREDRLSDSKDRQRAIAQSMEALGRISDLCAGAGEFANAISPAEACRYPAADLVKALETEAQAKGLSLDVHDPALTGHVRTLAPSQAAAAAAAIVLAALRNDPARVPQMSAGITAVDLVVASGDEATRARLIAPAGHDTFNAWRGGNGLRVPLAAKQLRETGARIWTLAGESAAVAIAIPLELDA